MEAFHKLSLRERLTPSEAARETKTTRMDGWRYERAPYD